MDLSPYRLFSIAPQRLVVSKCALTGILYKPSSGRKGDHEVVEGARVTFSLREFYCHALSLSRLRRQLPPRGSLSHIPTDRKHHQRKFLGGVRVFSAKYADVSNLVFYLLKKNLFSLALTL